MKRSMLGSAIGKPLKIQQNASQISGEFVLIGMENEVSDVTDRLEITELLNRHQMHIDLADVERYARLYAPDGAYESLFTSASGRSDIAKYKNDLHKVDGVWTIARRIQSMHSSNTRDAR